MIYIHFLQHFRVPSVLCVLPDIPDYSSYCRQNVTTFSMSYTAEQCQYNFNLHES